MNRTHRTPRLLRQTAALTALALIFLLGGCSKAPSGAPTLMDSAKEEIVTTTVQYGNVFEMEYDTGIVLPNAEMVLFPTNGTISSIDANPGQQVKKGDILARLNAEELQAQLENLQAEFAQIQTMAEYELTQLDLAYQQVKAVQAQLQAAGAPDYELELQSINAWEAWMAIEHAEQIQEIEQRRLKNQIAQLEEQLSQSSQILAPCDGVVTWLAHEASSGAYLLEGTEFMAVSDPDDLHIVTPRKSEEYRLLCDRIYAVIGDREYDLSMRERSEVEDQFNKTQGYTMTSTFDFIKEVPTSDDAANNALVVFISKLRENVLCLPSEAVKKSPDGYYVYVVQNGERIRTNVQVGMVTALRTEIVSGLEEGDVVYVTS